MAHIKLREKEETKYATPYDPPMCAVAEFEGYGHTSTSYHFYNDLKACEPPDHTTSSFDLHMNDGVSLDEVEKILPEIQKAVEDAGYFAHVDVTDNGRGHVWIEVTYIAVSWIPLENGEYCNPRRRLNIIWDGDKWIFAKGFQAGVRKVIVDTCKKLLPGSV